jgi:isopentenyl diphosphate isomerase/L-lactate dehydrogenase-like FMN-dependent dehydrogenase
VSRAITLLRQEVDKVLAQLGCARFEDLSAAHLRPAH